MNNKILYILILVFVVPSCSFKKQKIAKGGPLKRSPFDCDDRLILAKQLACKQVNQDQNAHFDPNLLDIPLPLDTIRLALPSMLPDQTNSAAADNNSCLLYKSKLEQSFLIDFFNQQMEVFGWQKEGEAHGFENIFIFTKLYKKTVISIRPCETKTSKTVIVVTLMNNQSDPATHRSDV